ncbi:MAG: peptidoglycan editing factor PgeF [Deltaproteobacteria bacterium]|nr:peptidoglycan editing factor PgeF [Deltaproteobacteria bacterium]
MTDSHALMAPRLRDAGFVHGFSTRNGGVSEGNYRSLNLGRSVGDSAAHVQANHTRFATAQGYAPDSLFEQSQVHGNVCYLVREGDSPEGVRQGQGDALVARASGHTVGVRVADCVPVLLADSVTGTVAAVHAGWRGITSGVVHEALRVMVSEGCAVENILAAIGPSIGPCCFEVGDEVAAQLAYAAGDGIVMRRGREKPHVDLWRAVELQLGRKSVRTVDTLGRCTVCEPELFFSFRRDGAQSGRMLAVISAK